MNKCFHIVLIVFTLEYALRGMNSEDSLNIRESSNSGGTISYEEIRKKKLSRCSIFGLNLLENLEKELKTLQDAEALKDPHKRNDQEIRGLENYVRDASFAVLENIELDEIEKLRKYKVGTRKILFIIKAKKSISDYVWDTLMDTRINENQCSVNKDGTLKFNSIYQAALYLDDLTDSRKTFHKKLGYESFSEGAKLSYTERLCNKLRLSDMSQ